MARALVKNTTPNIRASEGAGTTTLTIADSKEQVFNLSAGRTVVLPTTGIKAGDIWRIENIGTFDLTVQSSNLSALTVANGANYDATIQKGHVILAALQDAPTTPAHWQVKHVEEYYALTTNWAMNGSGGTQTNVSMTIQRVNKQATVWSNQVGAGANGSSAISSVTAFATRFRPTTSTIRDAILLENNSADTNGKIEIGTNGIITFTIFGGGSFTNATTGGTQRPWSFTWIIN